MNELTDGNSGPEAEVAPTIAGDHGGFSHLIGTTVDGRYTLRELLGEGGMGAVFIATHLKLQKEVAVKIIRPAVADAESIVERFRREARATAKIDNPHVIRAIDFGKLEDGSDFFVLQLATGKPLSDIMRDEGGRPWTWACQVCGQIADALAAVHDVGIIHRDLKPDNIVVSERDDGTPHVYVLDFGIARLDSDTAGAATLVSGIPQKPLTRAGAMLGTPGYMSPQQIAGDAVDHRADLYALGVILWECVNWKRLWGGNITESLSSQLRKDPAPLEGVPPELARVTARLLDRDPGARPDGAREVKETLRRLYAAERTGSHDVAAVASLAKAKAKAAAVSPATSTADSANPVALVRGGIVIAGMILLTMLILITVFAIKGGDDTDPAEVAKAGEREPSAKGDASNKKHKKQPSQNGGGTPANLAASSVQSGDVPPELLKAFNSIARSRSDGVRKKAAKTIQKYQPARDIPAYIRLAAELQLAKECRDKKAVVEQFGSLADPRGLPAIQRYEPRGFHACGRRDCYGCMRKTMADAIRSMGGQPSERTLKAIGEM